MLLFRSSILKAKANGDNFKEVLNIAILQDLNLRTRIIYIIRLV